MFHNLVRDIACWGLFRSLKCSQPFYILKVLFVDPEITKSRIYSIWVFYCFHMKCSFVQGEVYLPKRCAYHDSSFLIQIFHKLNPNTNSSGIKYTKVETIMILMMKIAVIITITEHKDDWFWQNEYVCRTKHWKSLYMNMVWKWVCTCTSATLNYIWQS